MAIVDFALEHARQGRLVFPGHANTKLPAIINPYEDATRDEAKIIEWWQFNPNYNICLPGGYEIGPGKYIGFVDVDCKEEGKNGFATMEKLELIGLTFPETLAQQTPTGGLHLFYWFDFPIRNSIGMLGPGLDTRGFHGYVLGAGSGIDGKGYIFKNKLQIGQAPDWLLERCRRVGTTEGLRRAPELGKLHLLDSIEQETPTRKAQTYLQGLDPATSGERNRKGYEAACRLKDFGLLRTNAVECMLAHWKSIPALETQEIEHVVNSAYRYGQNTPGVDSAESAFDALPEDEPKKAKPRHPIDVMNDEYALVTAGGSVRILWERKNHEGRDGVEHMSVQSLHEKLANRLMMIEDKSVPVSKLWMKSVNRREYDGICFAPNKLVPKFYNLWHGFSVGMPTGEPTPEAKRGLELFLEHIRENVCDGDLELTRWVLAFFAHLIQKPEDKPGVALVLRGRKGVGKNVITDCVFRLLGDHCILAANRRYLSGNFNSHLENKLLLVLDEAFWSGDKLSEGILKDMITGATHQIERKGYDSYPVANLLRVVIYGNEEWIVPATEDERRFAVFNVGDARRGDREYFGAIKDGMKAGGDQLLFQYLMNFDLSQVDVNVAPQTGALMSQKEHSLNAMAAWWLASLRAGYVLGSSDHEWPTDMPRNLLRDSFYTEAKAQNMHGRLPNAVHFGRQFGQMAPSSAGEVLKREGDTRYRVYPFATVEQSRTEFEAFVGGKIDWNN